LSAEKSELEIKLSDVDSRRQEIEQKMSFLQAENEDIRDLLSASEDERAEIDDQLEALNDELNSLRTEKNSLEGALQELQNQLEGAERRLKQADVDLQHATSLRESLTKSLRERESERDDATSELEKQYERNRELSRSFSNCLPKEKESQLISEISELKTANIELTQLLASSNESEERSRNAAAAVENECNVKARELEDALYRLSQMEEELRLSEMADFDEKKMEETNNGLVDRFELLEIQKAEVEALLVKEREGRKASEEDLKKQMGEEQRILINEGETRMLELRVKCEDLESRLSQSEAEAYVARQQVEEIRDQKKSIEVAAGLLHVFCM
jgi:chromosome segregation protein